MCFNGYKLFRFSLGIAGSVAGFCLGRFLIKATGDMGIEWSEIARIIVLAVLTIGLGVLAFKLYMKALIAITTLFERVTNSALRIVLTMASGIIAGVLIGIIVYYAQKWTISLFTAFVGARVISGVLTPILWSGILQGEYAGIIEQKVLGPDVELNYSLVRILILVAFCAAGFVIQLKTSKK